MTAPCQCTRGHIPCTRQITQEDLLCDWCRGPCLQLNFQVAIPRQVSHLPPKRPIGLEPESLLVSMPIKFEFDIPFNPDVDLRP